MRWVTRRNEHLCETPDVDFRSRLHRCLKACAHAWLGLAVDHLEQLGVGLAVCRGDEPACAGVQGLTVDAGDYASGDLAQGNSAGEVHAVAQVTIGYVGGSSAGGDPGHGQGRGDDSWPEPFDEFRIGEEVHCPEARFVRERRVEVGVLLPNVTPAPK